jgi:hypothetical protein
LTAHSSVVTAEAERFITRDTSYGDRQLADGSCGGGVGDVGFLKVAADERGLALAATEG